MPKPGYEDRLRVQTLQWAEGNPHHNYVDDECCPDFSCCQPDRFEHSEDMRWSYYRHHHGEGQTYGNG
jgi:hypothetical protein